MALKIIPVVSEAIWESFILENSPQSFFQSWTWGEIAQQLNQKMWRFGLLDNDRIVGIFQVVKVEARRGNFLHVRHGPIILNQTRKYWQEIDDYLVRLSSQEATCFIRVSPLIENSKKNMKDLASFGFKPAAIHAMDAEFCWVLDLNLSEEQLLAGMRKTTRYEVRRASKLGVETVVTTSSRDFRHFHNLYEKTSERHHFVKHRGVMEEFEAFAKINQAKLFLAKFKGEILAGALVVFYGNQAIYRHGASVPSKVPASSLLQWEAIKEAKKRGMKLYNFWGIAPQDKPKHPWTGHSQFKRGFGGRELTFLHAHDLPTSPRYLITRMVESIRRITKGY